MVLTVEPGLYIPPDDKSAPAKYRGIGIRIEDDVLVTEQGNLNLTARVPKTIDEIEAIMNDARADVDASRRRKAA
jgi:Xaa-Pro aminopeptidase